MARIIVCDLCKKEIKDPIDIVLPIVYKIADDVFYEAGKEYVDSRQYEMCEDCVKKIAYTLNENKVLDLVMTML